MFFLFFGLASHLSSGLSQVGIPFQHNCGVLCLIKCNYDVTQCHYFIRLMSRYSHREEHDYVIGNVHIKATYCLFTYPS